MKKKRLHVTNVLEQLLRRSASPAMNIFVRRAKIANFYLPLAPGNVQSWKLNIGIYIFVRRATIADTNLAHAPGNVQEKIQLFDAILWSCILRSILRTSEANVNGTRALK